MHDETPAGQATKARALDYWQSEQPNYLRRVARRLAECAAARFL